MSIADVVVVGGGAAGLMAAGRAAQCGARVLLLEKMNQPGRKLNITGKGRCNLTNTAGVTEFIEHFGRNGRFLRQAFARFFSDDLIRFIEELKVPVAYERGGRVFPQSGKAPDVTAALLRWVKQQGVTLQTGATVTDISTRQGRISGLTVDSRALCCHHLILTMGGSSYTRTGSTGDAYPLLTQLGHHITPIRPALVPLITGGSSVKKLSGLSLRNINVGLRVDGKKKCEHFGELAFCDDGVTGPVTLTLSGTVVDLLDQGHQVELELNLKPALSDKKLDNRLLRELENRRKEPLATLLGGVLPRPLIPFCLHQLQLKPDCPGQQVTAKERKALRAWLQGVRLPVIGYHPIEEALVTAGGVSLKEVDPVTMASKKIKGLYLAGELLDLHGDTGGYNLQAAFSTGWLAGQAAAKDTQTAQKR